MTKISFERLTSNARSIFPEACKETHYSFREWTSTEHILLGFLSLPEGRRMLELLQINPEILKEKIYGTMRRDTSAKNLSEQKKKQSVPFFTKSCKQIIEYAFEEADLEQKHNVYPKHILIGILREQEGLAGSILRESFDLNANRVRSALCFL